MCTYALKITKESTDEIYEITTASVVGIQPIQL